MPEAIQYILINSTHCIYFFWSPILFDGVSTIMQRSTIIHIPHRESQHQWGLTIEIFNYQIQEIKGEP